MVYMVIYEQADLFIVYFCFLDMSISVMLTYYAPVVVMKLSIQAAPSSGKIFRGGIRKWWVLFFLRRYDILVSIDHGSGVCRCSSCGSVYKQAS